MAEYEDLIPLRLKAVMLEFNIRSNGELGKMLGAGETTVKNWMAANPAFGRPKWRMMCLLCDETGLTLDWFYRGKTEGIEPDLVARLDAAVDNMRRPVKY